jgi:hypothetical protein
METRLHLGFQIVQTEHMDGTVAALNGCTGVSCSEAFRAFGRREVPTLPRLVLGIDRRERASAPAKTIDAGANDYSP